MKKDNETKNDNNEITEKSDTASGSFNNDDCKNEINIDDNTENDKSKEGIFRKKNKRIKKSKKSADLEKQIDELEKKNNEIKDKYIRLVAEYDNYRKRTAKEKLELRESATGLFLQDFLPILDDFDRAIEYNNKSSEEKSVIDGINIIYKKIKEFLKNKSIEEIDALHKEFDTDYHEALTKAPAPSKDLKGKVIDVIQKGYKLNDKVIRYSKVVVGE